jgi:NADH-quinone oxidoreductase subunit A
MLGEFTSIFVFVALGIFLVFFTLFLSFLLYKRKYDPQKPTTYECGIEPIGEAWIQFNMRYYIFALLFVVFDVEVVFLYPWAVVYKKAGTITFIEMMIFLLILILALIYIWKKEGLKWE